MERRGFLKRLGLAGLGAAVAPKVEASDYLDCPELPRGAIKLEERLGSVIKDDLSDIVYDISPESGLRFSVKSLDEAAAHGWLREDTGGIV